MSPTTARPAPSLAGIVTHNAAQTISKPPAHPHGPMRSPKPYAAISAPNTGSLPISSATRPSRPPAARRGRYVSNHSEVRLEGALADLGVAVVPAFVAREALDAGSLVRVLPGWEYRGNYQGHAYVLYPPNRFMAPKCRALVDHLLGGLSVSSSGRAPPRARS